MASELNEQNKESTKASFDAASDYSALRAGEPKTYETDPERAESMARSGDKAEIRAAEAQRKLSETDKYDYSSAATLTHNGEKVVIGVRDNPDFRDAKSDANSARYKADSAEEYAGTLHDRVKRAEKDLLRAQNNLQDHEERNNQ